MVAGGHLTPDPIESIYSGVVAIRSLRLVIFLAKLNNLEVWGADIGNAYLEAKTKEKLYIVAGPEFEELEGHILVIYKALYGLKSSGLRWSQKIHDIMLDMGFSLVEFWGLPPLIPLLQYVNRLGFEICSVNRMNNRTRKLGYINLNWPRCSARVTESLALTDGSFCQKQTLYILDYVKIVSL